MNNELTAIAACCWLSITIAFAVCLKTYRDIKMESLKRPAPPKPAEEPKQEPAKKTEEVKEVNGNAKEDAIDAIVSLGVKKQKAKTLVDKIVEKEPNLTVEEIVRRALTSKGN